MNIVKSVLRNKMGEKFMSDVMICYMKKDFSTMMSDAVVDIFKIEGLYNVSPMSFYMFC
jgi:hypothetical protein